MADDEISKDKTLSSFFGDTANVGRFLSTDYNALQVCLSESLIRSRDNSVINFLKRFQIEDKNVVGPETRTASDTMTIDGGSEKLHY